MFLNLLLTAIGGGIDSSQALVMSLAKRWRWESIWLVWAIFGCIVFPWVAVFIMLRDPTPMEVLREVSGGTIGQVMLYALGWGVGSVLFGMGVVRVGIGLGLGIAISLMAANGALLPLILNRPELLGTPAAFNLYAAIGVLIVGIVLCAIAAQRRAEEKPVLEREKTSFAAGIVCCIGSGLMSPLINMALDKGLAIEDAAKSLDASARSANMLSVAIVMSTGFIVNAGYCLYLQMRNKSWSDFKEPNTATYWFYGALMGLLQMAAFFMLTTAISNLDKITDLGGAVVAWPIYTASMILVGNVEGLLRGEWKGSDRLTYFLLAAGLSVLIIATWIVARLGGTVTVTAT